MDDISNKSIQYMNEKRIKNCSKLTLTNKIVRELWCLSEHPSTWSNVHFKDARMHAETDTYEVVFMF